jgi:hypothetical protein
MRRIILFALIALTATAGTAAADRHRGRDRDHRSHRWERNHDRRVVTRDHRNFNRPSRRVVRQHVYRNVDRRPIYVNNGRYTFRNGHTFHYRRPVINVRYTDYRYRPRILVENYDTVPGYIWVSGRWDWNGYEWNWIAGHYEIDPNYQYNDAYYYQSPVADHDCY